MTTSSSRNATESNGVAANGRAALAPVAAGEVLAPGFDYRELAGDDAARLRDAAERIRHRIRKQLDDIVQIGRDLIEVKAALPHGQFTRWLAAEFSWTDRTARNYMNVAEAFGAKSEKISDLRPSVRIPFIVISQSG
jgi:hypothetical protein